MKFRKKPIVIDAVRWWPPGDERHDPALTPVVKPAPGTRKVGDITFEPMPPSFYVIKTLEGPLRLSPGDWIITGVQGEKYPCKPDIFEQTYEAA